MKTPDYSLEPEDARRMGRTREIVGRPLFLCVAAILCLTVLFGFCTYGSGRLFENEALGSAYDSLSLSLVRGRADVDAKSVGIEAFVVNGKAYTYFAPLPALGRIPLNWLFPHLFGKWARTSCLLAAILAAVAFARTLIICLRANDRLEMGQKRFLFYCFSLTFAVGSPLVYMACLSHANHECILWAFCWSMWGISVLFGMFEAGRISSASLAALSTLTGAMILTRLSFALPFILILGVYAGVLCLRFLPAPLHERLRGLGFVTGANRAGGASDFSRQASALALPVAVAVLYYMWYNYARFGKPLAAYDLTYYFRDGPILRLLQEVGRFNVGRIPSSLYNYVGLSTRCFSGTPPYLELQPAVVLNPRLYYEHREWALPLTYTAPSLLIGGLAGVFVLLKRHFLSMRSVCLAAFACQVVVILSFHHIAQRYIMELLPFLVLGLGVLLSSIRVDVKRRFLNWTLATLLVLMGMGSFAVNALSAYQAWSTWPNWGVPPEYRRQMQGYGMDH